MPPRPWIHLGRGAGSPSCPQTPLSYLGTMGTHGHQGGLSHGPLLTLRASRAVENRAPRCEVGPIPHLSRETPKDKLIPLPCHPQDLEVPAVLEGERPRHISWLRERCRRAPSQG